MSSFKIYNEKNAPEKSKALLEGAKKAFGFIPNLLGTFAESPSALEAYLSGTELLKKTSLSPPEQQIILLSVSFENDCEYCMAVHTVLGEMQKLPADVIEAIRNGEVINDPKLEALRQFTQSIVTNRGRISDEEVNAFLSAGYSQANILDVLLGVSLKTLSNYTNHINKTPLDQAFESKKWTSPKSLKRAHA